MASSNGKNFCVTGHLCGEFTGPGEFPTQRPVTRSFDVSLICARINGWVNNGEAGDLRRHRAHYDVIVMGNAYLTTGVSRPRVWNIMWFGCKWECKAGTMLHIPWNTKHFCKLLENNHVVWFEYTEFQISIKPFTASTRILANVCWAHFCRKCLVATPRLSNNGPDVS